MTAAPTGPGSAPAGFECAPPLEEFAHRYRIENRLWRATSGEDLSGPEPQPRDCPGPCAPARVSA